MTSPRRCGWYRPAGTQREDGQIGVLVIGYVVLALLLATVVMAASAVYLEHKKLLSLADGAAMAAADSFMVADLGAGSLPSTSLGEERVKASADSYLRGSGAYGRHEHLVLMAGTGSEPGGTAVVVLTAVARPPVISFLLPDGIVVEARSVARSSLTQ